MNGILQFNRLLNKDRVRFTILLATSFAAILNTQAKEVRIWQTLFDDGTARENKLGINDYQANQNHGFVLLKELPSRKFAAKSGSGERSISVDPTRTFHTIQGIGAAMTDSSAWVLSQLKVKNPELYTHVMEQMFSEEGAGFSILRKPMGSSDYTAAGKSFTYADEPSDDLSTFSIDHDKRYIIPVLKDALQYNPAIELMGSPWSAPAWMKTNGDLNGITAEEKTAGKSNRLKPESMDLYADYFVKFIQDYAKEGITMNAVTLQNEPQFDAAEYPCMRMTVDDQIKFVRALGPKLALASLNTEIFVHDHNWVLHSNDKKKIGGDAKIEPIELVATIYDDPEAGKYVAGSAWHCYSGGAGEMKSTYSQLQKRFPDKKIYCTESTGWREETNKSWAGDCSWGLKHNWLGGLVAGASVGMQWNLVLDHKHGPTTRDDSLATGLLTVNTDTWESAKFEREFYAMAHVSKAARAGSLKLKTTVRNGGGNILVLAVQRNDGSKAMVVCNQNKDDREFSIECKEQALDLAVPGRSIMTLVWE